MPDIFFYASKAPFELIVNQGHSNIVADWNRLEWDMVFINGVSLISILKQRFGMTDDPKQEKKPIFTLDNLKKFFNDVILSKYPSEHKDRFVDILLKSFHQGGILHPVRTGLLAALDGDGFAPMSWETESRINILSTRSGLVIQEICTVHKCALSINAPDDLSNKFPNSTIEPDEGQDYVLAAEATISLKLENDQLKTDLVNQGINYGNKDIEKIADKRDWLTKLIDYVKSIFGFNAVKDLSEPESNSFKR